MVIAVRAHCNPLDIYIYIFFKLSMCPLQPTALLSLSNNNLNIHTRARLDVYHAAQATYSVSLVLSSSYLLCIVPANVLSEDRPK